VSQLSGPDGRASILSWQLVTPAASSRSALLRRAIREFREHYHHERDHQGLGNQLILPVAAQMRGGGRIVSREPLGGLLKYYHGPA
jgi:transposase InsO family protein